MYLLGLAKKISEKSQKSLNVILYVDYVLESVLSSTVEKSHRTINIGEVTRLRRQAKIIT
jgi:hypothetical protein